MKRVFITSNGEAQFLSSKSPFRACVSKNRRLKVLAKGLLVFLLTALSGASGLIAQIEFECHTENLGRGPEGASHCWPDDLPPCESTINFAPNPDFPEHTPVKYIKFVLHVFQNSNAVFPPGNFTNSQAHLDVLRSWFHHPTKGMNARMTNLCDPQPKVPGNESPFIPDSRVRLLFEGIENQDIFFYEDPVLWGGGYYCGNGGSLYDEMYDAAVTNNPAVNSNPNILNSVHVFLAGASASNGCGPGFWGGGYTWMFSSCGELDDKVGIVLYGNYYRYIYDLTGQSPDGQIFLNTTPDPGNIPYGGGGILAEWLHMVSVDHPGPNSHIGGNNPATNDGCADTPFPTTANNHMDSPLSITNRCALTECQLGRMHHFLEGLDPIWVRTEENGYAFPAVTDFCDISQPDIIIPDGADVVWNTHRHLRSNVIVESGGKLTIRCDVGMPENAKIVVEKNGRLNVDGARIYNNCDGEYWDGITVKGDKSNTQVFVSGLPKQGIAYIYNNSVIEHANTGVRLQDPNDAFSTGGILWAHDVTFRNCRNVMVDIRDYQNYNPYSGNAPTGNSTRFYRCHFIVDDGYSGDFAYFWEMAYLKNVTGIDFHECIFENAYPAGMMPAGQQYADYRKYGIYARNAGFSVEGKCLVKVNGICQQWKYSEFKGFNRAIYTGTIGSVNPFSVVGTKFQDNLVGIYAGRVDNIYVVDNVFEVGSDLPILQPQFGDAANRGIETWRCTGYKIEENTFYPYGGTGTTNPVGIYIQASGSVPNEVYKNTFNNLRVGNLAQGDNRGTDKEGLVYRCNENGGNHFDFSMPCDYLNCTDPNCNCEGTQYFGIAANQGTANLSAGNTFTQTPPDPESHIQNRELPITYFWHSGAKPSNVTTNKVALPINPSPPNQCPSNLDEEEDGILSETEKQQFKQDFQGSTEISVRAYAANSLIRHYLLDTVQQDLGAVRTWLGNKGDLESRFAIVDTWLQEFNADSAQTALTAVPNGLTLTQEEQTEYGHFSTFKSLQISALEHNVDEAAMVSQNLNTLTQLAESGSCYACVQVQILLNDVAGTDYFPPVILPQDGGAQGLMAPPTGNQGSVATSMVMNSVVAVPNPAIGKTVFHFRLEEGKPGTELLVKGLDGRVVWQTVLEGEAGSVAWEFGDTAHGVYFYSLLIDEKVLKTGKLVIIR